MSDNFNRRKFLKKSALMSIGIGAGLSFEEQALLAWNQERRKVVEKAQEGPVGDMPMGNIGKIKISRLICGGNLINGYAHSRDLMYVSDLLRHYFTDEKVIETLRISEENGINTCIMNTGLASRDENSVRTLNRYWKEGGKIQWIAQCDSYEKDLLTIVKRAIDNGAVGAFIQGGCGDTFIKTGRVDLIGKVVSFIKENGLIAGVGGHLIEVPIEVEKARIDVDFYHKTLHSHDYWSANPALPAEDNIWDAVPEKTIEFMKSLKKPWIAYKILAAGAINPRVAFNYSFKNGADFINVGMYDFQIKEDILIAKRAVSNNSQRERLWCA
jgi:hypothetical protein